MYLHSYSCSVFVMIKEVIGEEDGVLVLDERNYRDALKTYPLLMVEFYAPWCGHCTRFAPEYEQVALALKGKVKVGNVNCDKYSGMCTRAAITGYPTVRFYRGQDKGDMQDYFSEDIKDREQDKIVRVVELLVQRSQGDQDKKK